MAQLQDFPPCSPDTAGLDWRCGPCGQTRDSDEVEQANFIAAIEAIKEVDPEAKDFEVISWNHWACGWVEELFTRPGSEAEKCAIEMREWLDAYPVLDDDVLARVEAENKE